MKGETAPEKKGEKRERTGGSLTVIMCRKGVVQTAQGESKKERCEKVAVRGSHRITSEVEVPYEEKRGGKLPN